MHGTYIDLDWRKLLGFNQVNSSTLAAALQAKVGDKAGGGGIVGRPQELLVIKDRFDA